MQAAPSFLARIQCIRCTSVKCVLGGLCLLMGCSPVFNWRDVRLAQPALLVLFPCKPDQNERAVVLGSNQVVVTMLSCEAGGASFSVAYADMKESAGLNAKLVQWRQTTLGNVRAAPASEIRFLLKGASEAAPAVKVTTHGQHMDGTGMSLQAVWFALGTQLFQATITNDVLNTVASETFFLGIRPQ